MDERKCKSRVFTRLSNHQDHVIIQERDHGICRAHQLTLELRQRLSQDSRPQQTMVKALIFDLMGTCVDWHTVVSSTLAQNLGIDVAKAVATDWRAGFFTEIHRQFTAKESPEDIDVTHLRVLNIILQDRKISLDDNAKELAVASWHQQKGKRYVFDHHPCQC